MCFFIPSIKLGKTENAPNHAKLTFGAFSMILTSGYYKRHCDANEARLKNCFDFCKKLNIQFISLDGSM